MLEKRTWGVQGKGASFVAALAWILTSCVVAATVAAGCATGDTEFGDDFDDGTGGSVTTATTSQGGNGTMSTSSSSTTSSWPCGIDCSTIQTDDCHESVCNPDSKQCEVKSAADGTGCEDGAFCTVNDTCQEGICVAGDQNDCGMSPPQCTDIVCDEVSQTCSSSPASNGAQCTDPNDLCKVNTTCQNGLCMGTPKDCFFAPVPDDCHVAVCNPKTGTCDPEPGNEGQTCTDLNDLCTVSKTCSNGVCQGGSPKDCSALTVGCNLGVCDAMSGQCGQQPVNENDPCDDLDACSVGETCQGGQCIGGTAITQCINQDGCCPMGCTEGNDDDCSCSVNLALQATPSSSGGGTNNTGYGPNNFNDGKKESDCQIQGCSKCFGWVSNTTSPAQKWIQYDWSSAQQIGSMYLDANTCSGGCNNGRTVFSGDIQYWDGLQWVSAQTFTSGAGDLQFTFSPKLTTTKIRIYNITAGQGCGQASNSVIYEWHVWPGSSCTP